MRVLVTGASSAIGTGVVMALLARGDEVVGLQRTAAPQLAAFATDGSFRQVLGDVRDADAVHRASVDADAVVHLAARVGVVGDREDYRSVNVDGTDQVLAAARSAGIARFVHVSSPSVAHGGEPITGAGAAPPIIGRTRAWYAETKAIAELHAIAADSEQLAVTVVRPHLVWGPGDVQLVGRIVDRARRGRLALVGGGRALVDTTYLDNAVDALVAALDAVGPGAPCAGRAYVVANGEPRPIRELVTGICRAAGVYSGARSVPTRLAATAGSVVERMWPHLPAWVTKHEPEPPLTRFVAEQLGTAHWFDPRSARDDLGWTPRVSIDEGLERLAVWYAEQS